MIRLQLQGQLLWFEIQIQRSVSKKVYLAYFRYSYRIYILNINYIYLKSSTSEEGHGKDYVCTHPLIVIILVIQRLPVPVAIGYRYCGLGIFLTFLRVRTVD
jgi:hypothetical protein